MSEEEHLQESDDLTEAQEKKLDSAIREVLAKWEEYTGLPEIDWEDLTEAQKVRLIEAARTALEWLVGILDEPEELKTELRPVVVGYFVWRHTEEASYATKTNAILALFALAFEGNEAARLTLQALEGEMALHRAGLLDTSMGDDQDDDHDSASFGPPK